MPSDPRQHPSYSFYYDVYKEAAEKAKAAKEEKEAEARREQDRQQDAAFNQALGVAGATTAGAVAVPLITNALTSDGGSTGGGLLSGLFGGGGGATEVVSNIPAIEEVTLVPFEGGVSASGSAGAGGVVEGAAGGVGGSIAGAVVPPLAAIGGAALVGKGLKDLADGKDGDGLSRAQTAITTGGLSELGRLFGLGDHESTSEERRRRALALQDAGITTHYGAAENAFEAGGKFREDLAPDYVGLDKDGEWVNNKFAKSRNVNDLKAEDIWGHSAFYERFGNDWLGKFSEEQRRSIANKALNANIVTEGRGQIGFTDQSKLDEIIASVVGGEPKDDVVGDAVANALTQQAPVVQSPHPERFELV